ncbi:MAG: hypothetical protein HZA94_00190 [Candidatus Vogelbacteria bacterium]|nr:hypothetical protein [Candidatus Vogelbacteria bacterium]
MDTEQSIRDTSLSLKDSGNLILYSQKVLLKTERLTSALYLVTDLLNYDEPLKNKLRSSAIEVMSAVSLTFSAGYLFDDRSLSTVKKNISVILSCLEVSFASGACSSMNCTILKKEYAALRELLESNLSGRGPDAILIPSKFLYPSLDEIKSGAETIFGQGPSKGQLKDALTSRTSLLSSAQSIGRETYRGDRRGTIIALFKTGVEYTIKDILAQLSVSGKKVEISEKTVQRDLLSLVANGVLNKKGERRWSRYSRKTF